MKSHSLITLIVALAVAGLTLTGCGRKHDESDGHSHGKEKAEGKDDGHGHGEEAPSGASFKPGKGVILTDETRQSIGVETAEVAERRLPLVIQFNAQVFGENHKPTADEAEHTQCTAKASGLLSQTQAVSLQTGQGVTLKPKSGEALGGIVLRVNKALAIGDAEVVVGVTKRERKLRFVRRQLPGQEADVQPALFGHLAERVQRGDPGNLIHRSHEGLHLEAELLLEVLLDLPLECLDVFHAAGEEHIAAGNEGRDVLELERLEVPLEVGHRDGVAADVDRPQERRMAAAHAVPISASAAPRSGSAGCRRCSG